MPMQPSPMAETTSELRPRRRYSIGFLLADKLYSSTRRLVYKSPGSLSRKRKKGKRGKKGRPPRSEAHRGCLIRTTVLRPRSIQETFLYVEGAGGAGRKFDRILRASLFAVQFEREFDQPINEPGIRESRGFPEFRVHADGRETRDGVEFVDKNLPTAAFEKEIAAGHSDAIDRAEGAHCVVLKSDHLLPGQWRGNHEPRAFFQVLGGVIVELAMRYNLAGNRSANFIVAQDGDFDLPASDSTLHYDF